MVKQMNILTSTNQELALEFLVIKEKIQNLRLDLDSVCKELDRRLALKVGQRAIIRATDNHVLAFHQESDKARVAITIINYPKEN